MFDRFDNWLMDRLVRLYVLFGSMLLRVRADVAALGLPLMETSRVSALSIPTQDRQGSFIRTGYRTNRLRLKCQA